MAVHDTIGDFLTLFVMRVWQRKKNAQRKFLKCVYQ